jgi:mannose-6-phosphate isomerase-like protein (cupin superfamily)
MIIPSTFSRPGIHFFTPDSSSFQLGYMKRPADYKIDSHSHRTITRTILTSQEVLFIRSGKVRIDFFNDDEVYLESRVVVQGDVVLIASGGHGFEILEEAEMIEVKQGPYIGEIEKVVFSSKASVAE